MEILELPHHQSESLLRSGKAGRIAICTEDGPYVTPVNYSAVDQSVVICTTEDSFLAIHGPGATVAFEVDQFDYVNYRGWSVVARGIAHRIVEAGELSHLIAVRQPRSWADEPRCVLLSIPWSEITGRRLGSGWSIEEDLLVNRVMPTGANYV